jgi:hypothetical protein
MERKCERGRTNMITILPLTYKYKRGARGIIKVKALCYKPEIRRFETP